MPRRYSNEEVEARMVPQIVEAIYPVLIPVEQQDMRIQAANRAKITEVARVAWHAFVGNDGQSSNLKE